MSLPIFLQIALFLIASCPNEVELHIQKSVVVINHLSADDVVLKDEESINLYVWDKLEERKIEPPISGKLEEQVEGKTIAFIPAFPLLEGTKYVLEINTINGLVNKVFELPDELRSQPVVSAVYPTTDSLSENLLRMYIQFSQPMKTVGNLENIKLINKEGEKIAGAIFNNVHELWDSEQKQLTIILDPARVKTDLKVNKRFGRALEPGKNYQLIIEKAEDIYGQTLKQSYTKNIYVLKEDKEAPDLNNWSIIVPASGNTTALTLQFPQILDRMSLFHRMRILGPDGKPVKGKIEIGFKETSWSFTPFKKWENGKYILQVSSRLEDPAGNNLIGLFDHKIGGLKREREGEILEVEVDVR